MLNEEPRARPLLEENILPMLGIKTHQLMQIQFESDGDRLHYINQQSDFIMDWIGKICDDKVHKVRIIWIGYGNIKDYLQCLDKDGTIDAFNFFIFGARGTNIDKLDYCVSSRLKSAYPKYIFSTDTIQGEWIHKSKLTNLKWYFCRKSSANHNT